jgi:Flp pilus assembly protein TadD
LAEVLYLTGRHVESAEAYQAYAVRHPDDPAGYVGLAMNARTQGDTSSAAEHFDRALRLDPSNTLALKERAAIDLAQGHAQRAFGLLERAVVADPFDPELRYQRSLILARLGRRGEADTDRVRSEQLRREHSRMAEIEEALVATPRDIALRVEAATWMIAHGRVEEGVVWARLVLQDQPDNPKASRLLAEYHKRRGEPGLANHYRLHAGDETTPAPPYTPTGASPMH